MLQEVHALSDGRLTSGRVYILRDEKITSLEKDFSSVERVGDAPPGDLPCLAPDLLSWEIETIHWSMHDSKLVY